MERLDPAHEGAMVEKSAKSLKQRAKSADELPQDTFEPSQRQASFPKIDEDLIKHEVDEAVIEVLSKTIGGMMGDFGINSQFLMGLASHSNPAIMYLYNEIEKTQKVFEEVSQKATQ